MTTRIGFLGGGNIARFHLQLLAEIRDEIQITGVHDPDAERAAAFAADAGCPVRSSPEDVIDAADAVYVVTWTSAHLPLVRMVCDAGRALFCEKPLGRDLTEATALRDTVVGAGIPNQVGLILRRSPLFRLLKHVVDDPASGPPMAIVFRDDQHLPVRGRYQSTWRGERDKAGSGVLLEHSIHDVDLLEWILGPVREVSCTTSSHHGLPGIEDVATVRCCFVSGAEATLTTVWHDIDTRPSERHVEVFCQHAYAAIEGEWFGRFGREGPEPMQWVDGEAMLAAASAADPDAGVLPDTAFVRAVAAGAEPWPSVDVALRAHVVVDACYRSAADGGRPTAPMSG